MADEQPTSQEPPKLRAVEITAIIVFAVSLLVWLWLYPLVVGAFPVCSTPEPTDAKIGALAMGILTLGFGTTASFISVVLAVCAKRLPMEFRLLSVVPGLVAFVVGGWMLVLLVLHL